MFFDKFPTGPSVKKSGLKDTPPIPKTGWVCPTEFPRLEDAVVLSFDTETKEPDFDHGPGWARGKGHIVGVSVAAQDRLGNTGKWYFPVRHEIQRETNLDPRKVFSWLKPYMENPYVPKIGANLIYDVGWLTEEDIWVQGELHDVQFAEALLDNDARTALEVLGQKYCGRGKESSLMYDWIRLAYAPNKGKERGEIYRTPASLVGFYAEEDALLPMEILQKQWPEMAAQGLLDVYRMECDLIYVLVRMRRAGVRVDLQKAESLHEQLATELKVLYAKLCLDTGVHLTSVSSAEELAPILDKFGVTYKRTDKTGKASINKDFFDTVDHPIVDQIKTIRQIEKVKTVFLESYILNSHVNGKIHAQFHPLRSEEGGTVTGRFSSSSPNLQNLGSRTELGKKVRYMFIADEGHSKVGAGDYSQVEYRMLIHHGVGDGIDLVRHQYNTDPKTDYHRMTQALVKKLSGVDIPRTKDECVAMGMSKGIKEINFGLAYGMREGKLGKQMGLDKNKTKIVFDGYHAAAPYVKKTMEHIEEEVQKFGYITTISGRRTRFNMWEPVYKNWNDEYEALPYEQAIRKWGSNIKRAFAYRGVNYKLQGGAADVIKRAMWLNWKEGVYDVIGVPRLTVHDENVHSIIDESIEQQQGYERMIYNMENATKLLIPVRFDWTTGASWAEC